MHDDGRGLPESERCLRNVERLADNGDGQLARLSLGFYGGRVRRAAGHLAGGALPGRQGKADRSADGVHGGCGPRPPGMH